MAQGLCFVQKYIIFFTFAVLAAAHICLLLFSVFPDLLGLTARHPMCMQGILFSVLWRLGQDYYARKEKETAAADAAAAK